MAFTPRFTFSQFGQHTRDNQIQKHTHHRNYKHIQINDKNIIQTTTAELSNTQPRFTISRRTNTPTLTQKQHKVSILPTPTNNTDNKLNKTSNITHFDHITSTNHINTRSVVPSEHEFNLQKDINLVRKPSTLPSIQAPPTLVLPLQNSYTNTIKTATCNYAHSYASSTLAVNYELDDHKAKLTGLVLIYRKWLNDDIDMKMNINCKELGFIPIFALPIQSMVINVDICFETAFICMNIIFVNNVGLDIKDALFALPLKDGRVHNVSMRMNNIDTLYVNADELECKNVEKDNLDGIFGQSLDDYIADIFRLPIPLIGSVN